MKSSLMIYVYVHCDIDMMSVLQKVSLDTIIKKMSKEFKYWTKQVYDYQLICRCFF